MGEGSTSPVSLRCLSQRLIEGKEILATSIRGIPRSRASNTSSLRSLEYALMLGSFTRINLYATRCYKGFRTPNT